MNVSGRIAAAACAACTSAGLSVARAEPQELFVEHHRLLPAHATQAWALLDLDGDRDLDLVSGSYLQSAVWHNDGLGRFARADFDFPANELTQAAAVGDVDGDGWLDVVFANGDPEGELPYVGEPNTLYFGDGLGALTDGSASMPVVLEISYGVALGDVDGDRDLDLAFANGPSGEIPCGTNRIYLNSGAGVFTAAPGLLPAPCEYSTAVALGDVDGDRDLDLVFGGPTSRLWLNDGSGAFDEAVGALPGAARELVLGDVDADGDPDLVVTRSLQPPNGVELWRNDGGAFSAAATLAMRPSRELALVDVDGDGDLDVVTTSQDAVHLNGGAGDFTKTVAPASAVAAFPEALGWGDLDGDRDVDFVLGRQRADGLWFNDGAGRLEEPGPLWVSPGPSDREIADLDRDGHLDHLGALIGARNELLLGDGYGGFEDASDRLPADADPTYEIAVADVEGDGDLDVWSGNGALGVPHRLYQNDGGGVFTAAPGQIPLITTSQLEALLLEDVDGDGAPDALLAQATSVDPVRLFLNDGSGTFTEATDQLPAPFADARDLALADVDSDGDPDLVVANGSDPNGLFLNDGDANFTDASDRLPADVMAAVAVAQGDVDSDGDPDLVIGSFDFASGHNRLYLNDGDGNFGDASGQLPPGLAPMSAIALEDFDEDGDLDALVYTETTNGQRLLENDGTGVFTDASAGIPGGFDLERDFAVADVDHDGDIDVLGLRFWSNLTRHIAWRLPPRLTKPMPIEIAGQPQGAWMIYASTAGAFQPLPPAGILLLNRNQLVVQTGGSFDAQGRATFDFVFPAQPGLIGTTWYWQTLTLPERRLTNAERTVITGL